MSPSEYRMEEWNKQIDVSKTFLEKRQECLERITGEEGTMLRMNRSIQAEGSFSETKDGMGFRRYLSRGKKNVLAESIIVAMARNINKLHAKIQSDRTDVLLYSLKEAWIFDILKTFTAYQGPALPAACFRT